MKLSEIKERDTDTLVDQWGIEEISIFEVAESAFDAGAKAVMDEAQRLAAILDLFDDPTMCGADDDCFSDTGKLICRYCLTAGALARWTAFKEGNDEPG